MYRIDDTAFGNSNPSTITINSLYPIHNGFRGSNLSEATLYVPAIALNNYLISDLWTNFKNDQIKPISGDLTEITVDRDFILTNDKGIADKANLSLIDHNIQGDYEWDLHYYRGALTVKRKGDVSLNLGKFYQQGLYDGISTIIPYSEITADEIEVNLGLRKGQWNFLSFPFDVNVKDIKVEEGAQWVVRKYSGENRASTNENTWQNMADNSVLKAGEGYIFHCDKEYIEGYDNNDKVSFTFKPASEGNKLFAKDAVTKTLTSYPSQFTANASWNLVGNTYPAFLNIKALGFDAPVTVWNGWGYNVYSPLDDEYALSPYQAFFVQCQEGETGKKITLNPSGRAHTFDDATSIDINKSNVNTRSSSSPRSLFNILLTGEIGSDRTRVVVNEDAEMAYETSRDAAKFMSPEMNVPQIFVMNNSSRLAIDERPLAEGEMILGTRFGNKGEYTVSLETRNADGFVALLTDNRTGITTDLTSGSYKFKADESTDENRFKLILKAGSSAVDNLVSGSIQVKVNGNMLNVTAPEEIEVSVISVDGKLVASGKSANFSVALEKGIYVVKAGNKVTKVIVG